MGEFYNNLKSLKKCVNAARGKTVLVVGDVMLDRFTYGAVTRLSPESGAPVLDIARQAEMPGGAANVQANLQALGLAAPLLGVIGRDEAGVRLQALTGKNLQVSDSRPTTVKERFTDGSRQIMRADSELRTDLNSAEEMKLLKTVVKLIRKADAVVLSDYNKGVLTRRVVAEIMALAGKRNIPVLVDPKRSDFTHYAGAYAITPNRKELAQASAMPAHTDVEIAAAVRALMKKTGIARFIVTRSEDGLSVFEADAAPVHMPARAHEVVDVTGAGDTVVAVLAALLAGGAGLADAAAIANAAAAVAVGKIGTAQANTGEILAVLDGHIIAAGAAVAPINAWGEAAETVKMWREQGLKVGFTNGCFDILHIGHVSYLARARAQCDRLVVGLNHDQSVKILKGPTRPVHDEESRAAVLRALSSVDLVVLFGAQKAGQDNTPCDLVRALHPDIYFKGGDYTLAQLPEAAIMESLGGRTQIMPLYEGHSTTASIKKMKG